MRTSSLNDAPKPCAVRTLGKHSGAAAAFKSVAPNELRMLFREIAEPGQVKASGTAVIECGRLAHEILRLADDAGPHDVLAEIVADVAAGIRQSIGVQPRFREQEQARGFQRRSGHDDHSGADVVVLHGFGVDEVHAAGLAGLGIDRDFADHCIGAQRQVAGIRGRINQAGGRVKCGMNVATAFAFTGAASQTTAAIFVVLQSVAGNAGAILGERPAHFLQALA